MTQAILFLQLHLHMPSLYPCNFSWSKFKKTSKLAKHVTNSIYCVRLNNSISCRVGETCMVRSLRFHRSTVSLSGHHKTHHHATPGGFFHCPVIENKSVCRQSFIICLVLVKQDLITQIMHFKSCLLLVNYSSTSGFSIWPKIIVRTHTFLYVNMKQVSVLYIFIIEI